ncbi:hypothetical protein PATY110618_12015 [Paenibacillus typhae]|uniref:Uncharacterized protein n=1 Tax=Paenibacillus typhae TaxID=1174501 RepID=A0A1G8ZXY5_9BACL|nr:hypothetical protein SAMN05216192_13447 [Paenibacillus typhae]
MQPHKKGYSKRDVAVPNSSDYALRNYDGVGPAIRDGGVQVVGILSNLTVNTAYKIYSTSASTEEELQTKLIEGIGRSGS